MRQRGDSINHSMIDMGLFPTPHLSLSWAEQWGESNRNLTGLSLSLFTPVLGIGANYYRVFPEMLNIAFENQSISTEIFNENVYSSSSNSCFVNPTIGDIMKDGRKVAGAAQRRTRMGLLHQCSIQGISVSCDFSTHLVGAFAKRVNRMESLPETYRERAMEHAVTRYSTLQWNHGKSSVAIQKTDR